MKTQRGFVVFFYMCVVIQKDIRCSVFLKSNKFQNQLRFSIALIFRYRPKVCYTFSLQSSTAMLTS